jgi:hypothetical protein
MACVKKEQMMIAIPRHNFADGDLPDLPEPDVEFMATGTRPEDITAAGVKGLTMNPIYADVGQFTPSVTDKEWVAACRTIIEGDGSEQFLVNMLALLRSTFGHECAPCE